MLFFPFSEIVKKKKQTQETACLAVLVVSVPASSINETQKISRPLAILTARCFLDTWRVLSHVSVCLGRERLHGARALGWQVPAEGRRLREASAGLGTWSKHPDQ